MWFWSKIFGILRNSKVDLHLARSSSFLFLTGCGIVNMFPTLCTNLRYYNDKDLEHIFCVDIFAPFGRNSVNNWLFSLSFDWCGLLYIYILIQRGCRCIVNSVRTKSVYQFVLCLFFSENVMWLCGSRICRLNSFNCYILFLLWTVQLNVLRWLNGIEGTLYLSFCVAMFICSQ